MAWKNNMDVFHTDGVLPSSGRAILAIIGSTRNSSSELMKIVRPNSRSM
jgi:hypothetical protein